MPKHGSKLPMPLQHAASGAVRLAFSPVMLAGYENACAGARALARVYKRAQPQRFDRAVRNLSDAYPSWSRERVDEYALRAYEHLFQIAVEFLYVPRLITHEACMRHLAFTDIGPGARAMLSGRPIILISGHVGNWELIGYAMGMLGFDIKAVYRPLDLRPLDDWVYQARQRRGLTLVSKFGAMKTVPDALAAGSPIGFVADQSGGDRGVYVPFFGRLTSTYKSIGLLAMQHNATIVCGMARRLGPGDVVRSGAWEGTYAQGRELGRVGTRDGTMRFSVELTDVFGPEDWQGQPDPLYYLTARYRRAIEMMVRSCPEQYFWMHRVWRTRPAHERKGQAFPQGLREKLASLPWMNEGDVAAVVERSERDTRDIRRTQT